jgi:diguanylate cyclase (GGDEF)-like protein
LRGAFPLQGRPSGLRSAELDVSLDWVRARAATAPKNFLHMVRLIEAERAWALADFSQASAAFEAALRDVEPCKSPRHQALIAERAALCHLEHGLERYGRLLLTDAHRLYDAWGADAKVHRLEADYPFLLDAGPTAGRTMVASSDAIDMVAILQASQAISSATSVRRLKKRVVELLAGLTGATAVLLVLRDDDTQDWLFSPAGDENVAPIPVKEAGVRGLLPLAAFRYVERTQEPLLLADATRDDRFARDPYFADCEQCSMLLVPISSHGEPRAVLLLENRLGRDAFSTGRLDSVMLIAGQLAVSLDNALLYASLERKVAERTEALAAANEQLALLSFTDALTGLANRRGFDEQLQAEWRRALRARTSIGLAMIDIDEFKKYNDRYGHAAGDACLRRVAKTLNDGLRRTSDLAARYGGEEFVLILPDTSLSGLYLVAEKIRAELAAIREPHPKSVHGIVTISIGVVAFVPSPDTNSAEYLKAADVALYEAKHNGRNQVVRAGSASALPLV